MLTGNLTLLTRDGDHWRDVDNLMPNPRVAERLLNLTTHLGATLPELASATAAIINQLHARDDILVSTRECDGLDHLYKWAPTGTAQLPRSGPQPAAPSVPAKLSSPGGAPRPTLVGN